jgi:TolB protein
MNFYRFSSLLMVTGALASGALAQDIRIVGDGSDGKITISLAGLSAGAGAAERQFVETLRSDLNRSGWFTVTPGAAAAIQVLGTCRAAGASLEAQAEVLNAATRKSYFSRVYRGETSRPHVQAHVLADAIVEAVKGVKGIAATRIVMVGSREGKKDLYVIGVGGNDLVQLTRDGAPCLAPAWSPDARTVFYTSFVRGFPDVYRIDLEGGRRTRAAGYPGVNAGAKVSPDGRFLALVLSKDGNPEIYTLELGSGQLSRITRTPNAAEASPCWSPDGRQLAFVSDSTGSPQLYVASRSGGAPVRISFRGNENVSPSWGPDGRLVYSSRREGRYQLCIYDPKTRSESQVTAAVANHDSPSWAPDSRHIVYSRTEGYASSVYILDTMGDSQVRLTDLKGDWYFPAWSPR